MSIIGGMLLFAAVAGSAVPAAGDATGTEGERSSRISDEVVTELDLEAVPQRPEPIIDLGPMFLGNGNIKRGIELPTGAIWQPALVVFGTYRTALQTFNAEENDYAEWANRLDLFANLQLSGSERVVFGVRPLDDAGEFTSYQFKPDNDGPDQDGWNSELNFDVDTLFFEGDFGEIFPSLDPEDRKNLDLGFSIGRQSLNYQAGMLINDRIDAIGVIRNNLLPTGVSDLQVTFLYGWNEIHRGDNVEGKNQDLYALLLAADTAKSTVNVDMVYVSDDDGDDDGFFWGVSDVRRIGHYNLSARVLGSHALENESAAVGDGYLLFAELSWTPPWTNDNVYINAFAGINDFTSAARDPSVGGPLGRTGILFQAIGMGRYGAPLGNYANDSVGAAVGYQWFIHPIKNQFIFELGARDSSESDSSGAIAGAVRYRQVMNQHTVFQLDMFCAYNDSNSNDYGGRLELRFEF